MTLLFVYLFIAVGVSFLCSVLEAVLLSIPQSFVAQAAERKNRGSKVLVEVKESIDQSISSILILNTFAHTMGAAGVGVQAIKVFGADKETLVAVILTLIILYFSEIIPKTLGARFWRKLAIPSVVTIAFLVKVMYPMVWFSLLLTRSFNNSDSSDVSREEVLAIASLGSKGGAIANQESALVESIFSLRTVKTEDILTPRVVVHALDETLSITEALNDERTKTFTRIPVYHDSLDNITGVVLKATLFEKERNGKGDQPLSTVVKKLRRVSESLPVLNLLDIFIKKHEHIFLVEDKFGQTAGIVSLEDAIETLIGREIVDESDTVVDMQNFAKAKFRERLKERYPQVILNDKDSDD